MLFNPDLGFGFLYRYDEVRYSNGIDQWDDPLPGYTLRLELSKYAILKNTPKGAWIDLYSHGTDKKFVNLTANKKFACRTEEDAKVSFMARKERQIKILEAQLHQARLALSMITVGGTYSKYPGYKLGRLSATI